MFVTKDLVAMKRLFILLMFFSLSSQAVMALSPSRTLVPSDLLEQEIYILQQMQGDARFPEEPALVAMWISGAAVEDQKCQDYKVMDRFYSIPRLPSDNFAIYQVRLAPVWSGQTCEYRFEKRLLSFLEAQKYIMGGMGFSIEIIRAHLKISYLDAVTAVQTQHPTLTVGNLILKSPLPPQNPPLYFHVIATACAGTSKEIIGDLMLQASSGSISQNNWVPESCE